jgi:hypothetical protein
MSEAITLGPSPPILLANAKTSGVPARIQIQRYKPLEFPFPVEATDSAPESACDLIVHRLRTFADSALFGHDIALRIDGDVLAFAVGERGSAPNVLIIEG